MLLLLLLTASLAPPALFVRLLSLPDPNTVAPVFNSLPCPCRVVLSEAVDGCICFTRKIQHGGDRERSRTQSPKNVHNFL